VPSYRVPRIVSMLVSTLGWIVVGAAALILLLTLLRLLPPFLFFVSLIHLPTFLAVGLGLVLLGHVARAIFDIADYCNRPRA